VGAPFIRAVCQFDAVPSTVVTYLNNFKTFINIID
jgi:hypothetical protein